MHIKERQKSDSADSRAFITSEEDYCKEKARTSLQNSKIENKKYCRLSGNFTNKMHQIPVVFQMGGEDTLDAL